MAVVMRGREEAVVPADMECITLPLIPGHPSLGTVNAWLILGRDNDALIDTGSTGEATATLWRDRFSGPGRPVVRDIVCTHAHFDHIGQIEELTRLTSGRVNMSAGEIKAARWTTIPLADRKAEIERWMTAMGLSAEETAHSSTRAAGPAQGQPLRPHRVLAAGEAVMLGDRNWEVITGGGHSPEAICLFDHAGGIIFSGDQLLGHMTPFVGFRPEAPQSNPLAECLSFLDAASALPGDAIVLPGHGAPFLDAPGRARQLRDNHLDRVDRALAAARTPGTCRQLVGSLFRQPPTPDNLWLHCLIAMATLRFCTEEGLLRQAVDEEGRLLFETAS